MSHEMCVCMRERDSRSLWNVSVERCGVHSGGESQNSFTASVSLKEKADSRSLFT
jgi:hypothetical protein